MTDPNILTQMDCCRAGSNDLSLPEMQLLAEYLKSDENAQQTFEQRQMLDAELKAAVVRPPVPEGLEQRLLQGIALTPSDQPAAGDSRASRERRAISTGRISKWRWALALSAVLAFWGVGFFWWSATDQHSVVSQDALAGQLVDWLVQVQEPTGWRSLENMASDAPAHFLRVDATGYKAVRNSWSRHATAYRLDNGGLDDGGGENAYLFVLQTSRVVRGLGVGPPRRVRLLSGGWKMAAWQQGDRLFVLVFRGEKDRYRRLVKTNVTSA